MTATMTSQSAMLKLVYSSTWTQKAVWTAEPTTAPTRVWVRPAAAREATSMAQIPLHAREADRAPQHGTRLAPAARRRNRAKE